MIIDCHYHLDERLLRREELLQRMDEAGVEKVALMGAMVDPFPEPARPLIGLLQILITHRSLRAIGRLMIDSFTKEGDVKLPLGVFRIEPDPDNDAVFAAVRGCPQRFAGWVFVNPRGRRDPVREVERWQNEPGFVGAKAHPFWHRYPPEELAPVARLLSSLGKPLLIHAGFGPHGDYEALLQQVPDLTLILAHGAFPLFSDAWPAIRERKNVFVDLSQSTYLGDRTTREAVAFLGPERCLFGTDGPFGFPAADGKFDYGFLKRRIERLFPDPGMRRRLLGENFAALAGIG